MMKKWLWMPIIAILAMGCSNDNGKKKTPDPAENALSTLTGDAYMENIALVRLEYDQSGGSAHDTYFLTLATGEDVLLESGTGAYVRFELSVEKGGVPFGRYIIGEGSEQVITGLKGESWYYVLEDGVITEEAPLCGGQLTLSTLRGTKPSYTRYYVVFNAIDDDKETPHTITGEYFGLLDYKARPGAGLPNTTYVYAGVSGYSPDDDYTTWSIDFDSEDFTKHMGVFWLNGPPDIAEEDGIPAGVYDIVYDDAPYTVTWINYSEEVNGILMVDLEEGTFTVEREGNDYKVFVDAIDEDGQAFTADFEGPFYYENNSKERILEACEVYAVYYGPKDGGVNWYISMSDRGYLETADAVGNYYYGSVLRLDLFTDSANDFTDGIPEGTYQVRDTRSGIGVWGGDIPECTSFLTEYFSGSISNCKLTGGTVRIKREGEQATITLEGIEMAGKITSLDGTYTGKIQYIDYDAIENQSLAAIVKPE